MHLANFKAITYHLGGTAMHFCTLIERSIKLGETRERKTSDENNCFNLSLKTHSYQTLVNFFLIKSKVFVANPQIDCSVNIMSTLLGYLMDRIILFNYFVPYAE